MQASVNIADRIDPIILLAFRRAFYFLTKRQHFKRFHPALPILGLALFLPPNEASASNIRTTLELSRVLDQSGRNSVKLARMHRKNATVGT